MDTDRIPSLQAVAMRIQGALGNGIDQQAWRPGEHWLDAAVRVLEERFEREAYIAKLEDLIHREADPEHLQGEDLALACAISDRLYPHDGPLF